MGSCCSDSRKHDEEEEITKTIQQNTALFKQEKYELSNKAETMIGSSLELKESYQGVLEDKAIIVNEDNNEDAYATEKA